jgi:hypothetical protein
MGRRQYLYRGILWIAVGTVTLAWDITHGFNWFTLWIFGFPLSVSALALILGAAYLYYHRQITKSLSLTKDEILRFSGRIQDAIPEILAMIHDNLPVREIAKRIESAHAIPQLVTLKFIIAMGDAKKKDSLAERNE